MHHAGISHLRGLVRRESMSTVRRKRLKVLNCIAKCYEIPRTPASLLLLPSTIPETQLLPQSMRGSIPTRLYLNGPPPPLRTASWIHMTASQPRHYATESPKGDPNHKKLWIHSIALALSSWISSHQAHRQQRPRAIIHNSNLRWAHYFALGLRRDASQEDIKVSLQAGPASF